MPCVLRLIVRQGTVKVAVFNRQVLVAGRQSMNRAMQGDVVALEMLPRSEWRAPADAVVDQDGQLPSPDIPFLR